MAGVWVIKVCDDVEGVNDEVGVIVSTIYQAMYIHVVNYCIIHSIATSCYPNINHISLMSAVIVQHPIMYT